MIRSATTRDAVRISQLLLEALQGGSVEGNFTVDKRKLLEHVMRTIVSADGFAYVSVKDNQVVGCFMAELERHAYIQGYIASELGAYMKPEHRASRDFIRMLDEFLAWSDAKPDVLFTAFSIGQINEQSEKLARLLERRGFTKGNVGYYRL